MTPATLLHLRKSRGLTREELATELGGCTAQAIVKWERGERAIPEWVEEKMLRTLKVTLPLEELHWLLSESISSGQSAESILAEAIRLWLHNRQKPTSKDNIIPIEPPLPPRKNVSYGGSSSPDISQVAEEHGKHSND